jgi:hypothetical protein
MLNLIFSILIVRASIDSYMVFLFIPFRIVSNYPFFYWIRIYELWRVLDIRMIEEELRNKI